jgi:RES domain-containing protein
MLQGERLLGALAELPTGPKTGTAYRLIHVKYAQTPLSAAGAIRTGGRYNLVDVFEALYLADSPVTALQEVQAIIAVGSSLIPVKGPPRILLSVDYTLESVLDLTGAEVHSALGTSFQELTGAWMPYALQKIENACSHSAAWSRRLAGRDRGSCRPLRQRPRRDQPGCLSHEA